MTDEQILKLAELVAARRLLEGIRRGIEANTLHPDGVINCALPNWLVTRMDALQTTRRKEAALLLADDALAWVKDSIEEATR
jgi:hypothetical protein